MIAFNKPALSNLTNELVVAMCHTVLGITSSLESDIQVKQIRATMIPPLDEIDRALLRESKNPFTAQLSDLDFQRDQVLIAIRSHCIAAIDQYMNNKTKAEQAAIVYELLKKMSARVTELGYQEESTEIHALLTGANLINGAVEESEALPLFSILGTVQKKFDALYLTKVKTDTKGEEPRRIKPIRKELTDGLTDLFNHIGTASKFNPVFFESAIIAINSVTAEYDAKVAAAKTRKENVAK